ncbi:hypothetical protein B0A48_03127 [Cryoendolithus antarcticus]|uniref:Glycerol uptake protein 1 n=1 Tax=Cryoendolithus antarcticus TaxID=1507870 RepID=A0A1V8TM86_9PEZI|nr:hypothetical protein B0A48_03127 [Cryoendolithus antarcticus]
MYGLGRLYAVETLDTRLGSKSDGKPLSYAQPSKWRTPEYFFYYFIFLTIPPLMVKAVYDVSGPWHPSYKHYESLLEPGWIPGRKVDNSDAQYRGFRENIPYMGLLVVLHPLARRLYEKFAGSSLSRRDVSSKSGSNAIETRKNTRIRFDLVFAIIFILALHGISAFKILLILYLNYQIATALPRRHVPVATWVFNIGTLFANELGRGYPLAKLASFFSPQTDGAGSSLVAWAAQLDSYGGLLPRWEVLFNICVLRMISFNIDYTWSFDHRAASPIEKKNLDPSALSERDRISIPPPQADFTFGNFLAYVLYAPLYLTGPIITFNDYIYQCRHRLPSIQPKRTALYALRFLLSLLCMELVLHYLYAVAISKSHPDWSIYTPFQLSMLAYFNLHVIWLKLLLPWRFFRLWALLDGIDPPENMVRCMSDNYSALAFWRNWHRSFNRWITRYIYIPLGGSRGSKPRAVINFLAVFTFVALWHDINLRLLAWGWLISLFVLPEVLATLAFPAKKYADRPNTYRVLCGMGAVGNILMMMAANLVGFAVGLDGLKGLVDGIVGSWDGRIFLLGAMATLFVGVQVMFEWREGEKRRGIDLKC